MKTATEEVQQTTPKPTADKQLGFVFDIDGTLIAEGDNIQGLIHRPGAIDFLKWLVEERGHAVALWTAAWSGHADRVATDLCQRVSRHDDDDGGGGRGQIPCRGVGCGKTFDFVWDGDKLRYRKQSKFFHPDDNFDACRWCECYRHSCKTCVCSYASDYCKCRYTKDLSKVWHDQDQETVRFTKERTLIVENTPQMCIWNYGNAIYVPTYKGHFVKDKEENMFERLKMLVVQLEAVEDVRAFRKCSHRKGPHPCFEQDWWRYQLDTDQEL